MTINKLTKLIEKSQQKETDEIRDYIGASGIGSSCMRQIWYQFKGFEGEPTPAKTRRTRAIGKHLEGLILDWLEKAGVEIARTWYDLSAEGRPYFRGHVDSVWTKKGEPVAIIEVKTAKHASFTVFVSKGVKIWDPKYYAQIQAYMGMSEIYKAYILVLDKDNSDLADEMVEFDADVYDQLKGKADMIARAASPPPRVHGSPLWWQCRACKFNRICHEGA